jgi:hypothetical protein
MDIIETIKQAKGFYVIAPKDNTSFIYIEGISKPMFVSLFKEEELAYAYLDELEDENLKVDYIEDICNKLSQFDLSTLNYVEEDGVKSFDYKEVIKVNKNIAPFMTKITYDFEHDVDEEIDDIFKTFSKSSFWVNNNYVLEMNDVKYLLLFSHKDEILALGFNPNEFKTSNVKNIIKDVKDLNLGLVVNPASTKMAIEPDDLSKIEEFSMESEDKDIYFQNILDGNIDVLKTHDLNFIVDCYFYAKKTNHKKKDEVLNLIKISIFLSDEFFIAYDYKNNSPVRGVVDDTQIIPVFVNEKFAKDYIRNVMKFEVDFIDTMKISTLQLYSFIDNLRNDLLQRLDIHFNDWVLPIYVEDFLYNLSLKLIELKPEYSLFMPSDILLEANARCLIPSRLIENSSFSNLMSRVVYIAKDEDGYICSKFGTLLFSNVQKFLPAMDVGTKIFELTPSDFYRYINENHLDKVTYIGCNFERNIPTFQLKNAFIKQCIIQDDVASLAAIEPSDFASLLGEARDIGTETLILKALILSIENLYIVYDGIQNKPLVKTMNGKGDYITCSLDKSTVLREGLVFKKFTLPEMLYLAKNNDIKLLSFLTNTPNDFALPINEIEKVWKEVTQRNAI